MRGPLNIKLADFGVSAKHGFLPEELPLQRLDSFYGGWEDAAQLLTSNFERKTYREKIDSLPILTTSLLKSERAWQRAYVLLTFMTHGYIWGGAIPSEVGHCTELLEDEDEANRQFRLYHPVFQCRS